MVAGYDDATKAAYLESKGIEVLRGSARLAGPGTVHVDDERYSADNIVLATGSDPVIPPIPGLRELDGVWTNREVTALTEVPRRLLVLGGGPVGVEMAQAVHRLGASVALVEGMEGVLPREPKPLGDALGTALEADGIELYFGEHASGVRRDGGEFVLEFAGRDELRGERLLVATGRRARVDGLGLDTVGVEPTRQGIPVDERMRVADGVWAIGDVTGLWPLTYMGKYQGRVAAANILGRDRTANYDAVPRVVFTDPQAASVGDPDGPLTRHGPARGSPAHIDLYTGVRGQPRLHDARLRRRAAHRRLRARARGWRMAPAGHGGDPRARAALRAVRRHPAIPELLGGLPGHPARPRGSDHGEPTVHDPGHSGGIGRTTPMEIRNSVAVVTGANRGLGRHFAAQLLERGAAKLSAAPAAV